MTNTIQDKSILDGGDSRPDWLPEGEYPFRLRSIDLDGDAVTYIDEGAGPALLFVHTGLWSFVYRDVIERLRSDFRCITLDFPGSGLSPDPQNDDPLIEESSAVLEHFIDSLGLSDITLVAHDLGGPVALGLARRRPQLIEALVLSQAFAWNPNQASLRGMLRFVSSSPVRALNLLTNFLARGTTTRFGIGRHLSRGAKKAFRGAYRDHARRRRFHELTRNVLEIEAYLDDVEHGLRSELADRPVLTIFGERNDPWGFQDRFRSIFPNLRSVVVPKGYHFPMMDDPDLFSESVREWWREAVAARPPLIPEPSDQ